jgi:hypothetical protein
MMLVQIQMILIVQKTVQIPIQMIFHPQLSIEGNSIKHTKKEFYFFFYLEQND